MTDKWIKVSDALPPSGVIVIVKSLRDTNTGIATYDPVSGLWMVQPFLSPWYYTRTGITEWQHMEKLNEETYP